MDISYNIMNQYIKENNKSIEKLKELAIKYHDNKSLLEIVVGSIKDNKTIVYQISSYNNFDIVEKIVNGNNIGLWTGGIKTNECFDYAYKEIKSKIPLIDVYQNTFDDISFEGIGGQLSVYKLDKNNIDLVYKNNIKEKDIKKIYLDNYKHLIVAERLTGQIIVAENLTIDATNSSNQKIFTVNSEEVNISGLALTITATTGGNGLSLSDADGLIITKSDDTIRTKLNATEGISIETSEDGINWIKKFFIDANSNLSLTGNIVSGTDILLNASTKTFDLSKFTTIIGSITAANINSTNLHVSSANIDGTITANAIVANASITSPTITGGIISIGSGTPAPFTVNSSGVLTAIGANISGDVISVNGTSSVKIKSTYISNGITWPVPAMWMNIENEDIGILYATADSVQLSTLDDGVARSVNLVSTFGEVDITSATGASIHGGSLTNVNNSALTVFGNINFTGNLYKNGSLFTQVAVFA